MFNMCVPLPIIAEIYAKMFVIFDRFYQSVIKYQLRKKNSKFLRVNRTASVFKGLNFTNHCLAQLESIMRSWFIIPDMSARCAAVKNKELSSANKRGKLSSCFAISLIYEPVHEIFKNVVSATSKASGQPADAHSLIRAFASRLSIL